MEDSTVDRQRKFAQKLSEAQAGASKKERKARHKADARVNLDRDGHQNSSPKWKKRSLSSLGASDCSSLSSSSSDGDDDPALAAAMAASLADDKRRQTALTALRDHVAFVCGWGSELEEVDADGNCGFHALVKSGKFAIDVKQMRREATNVWMTSQPKLARWNVTKTQVTEMTKSGVFVQDWVLAAFAHAMTVCIVVVTVAGTVRFVHRKATDTVYVALDLVNTHYWHIKDADVDDYDDVIDVTDWDSVYDPKEVVVQTIVPRPEESASEQCSARFTTQGKGSMLLDASTPPLSGDQQFSQMASVFTPGLSDLGIAAATVTAANLVSRLAPQPVPITERAVTSIVSHYLGAKKSIVQVGVSALLKVGEMALPAPLKVALSFARPHLESRMVKNSPNLFVSIMLRAARARNTWAGPFFSFVKKVGWLVALGFFARALFRMATKWRSLTRDLVVRTSNVTFSACNEHDDGVRTVSSERCDMKRCGRTCELDLHVSRTDVFGFSRATNTRIKVLPEVVNALLGASYTPKNVHVDLHQFFEERVAALNVVDPINVERSDPGPQILHSQMLARLLWEVRLLTARRLSADTSLTEGGSSA